MTKIRMRGTAIAEKKKTFVKHHTYPLHCTSSVTALCFQRMSIATIVALVEDDSAGSCGPTEHPAHRRASTPPNSFAAGAFSQHWCIHTSILPCISKCLHSMKVVFKCLHAVAGHISNNSTQISTTAPTHLQSATLCVTTSQGSNSCVLGRTDHVTSLLKWFSWFTSTTNERADSDYVCLVYGGEKSARCDFRCGT